MKKQLFVLIMVLLPMVAIADQSGTCGENVNWSFVEATHTLTISGDGGMENYMTPSTLTPWYDFRSSITKVIIEEGVTSIGNEAFWRCTNVIDVAISSSVITIGRASFSDCSSLLNLKIPNSITSIGEEAFSGCSSLTSVDISDISAWCNIDFAGAYSNPLVLAHELFVNGKLAMNLTIPNTVAEIKKATFMGCSSLTSVVVPSSVTLIGESAFQNCSGLFDIKMSEGLNTIGFSAFSGCSSLNSIIIPNSVLTIDDLAFSDCTSLISVILPNGITAIQPGTFYGCESLVSIEIPEGVTTLKSQSNRCWNYGCFRDCISLVSVSLPHSLITIEDVIFYGCSSLTSITIPDGVISIGNSAFGICSNLQSLTLPNGVKSIGDNAFEGCSGITSISIPNSIESIGIGAFTNCKGLTSVTIPSNLLFISERAFSGCSGLITLSLPENLQIIRNKAFYGCSSLKNLTIPASVELVYQEAFAGCSSLAAINAQPTTPPFIYSNTFSDYLVPVNVPSGYVDAYKAHDVWKNFTNITDGNLYYQMTIMVGKNGRVTFGDNDVTNGSKVFDVKDGNNATLTINPDAGYQVATLTVNGADAKSMLNNGTLTISNVTANKTVEVTFELIPGYTESIKMSVPNGDRTAIGYSSSLGLDFTNVQGVKAWIVSGFTDDATVLLSRVKIVPPNTGLYLTSDVAGIEVDVPTTDKDIYYANLLKAAVDEETIQPTETHEGVQYTNFVVGKLTNGEMGFVRVKTARTLGPNKSRLLVPSSYYPVNAPSLHIEFVDETTTDIKNFESERQQPNGHVFDLQGRKLPVGQAHKGMYIYKGKKYVIK